MGTCCVTKDDSGSSRAIDEATTAMTTQSATDIREHLQLLETERALALETALAHDPAYMADLREEIVATRHAYVGSAVAEIASFRAALSGAQVG
jgi:septum formation topological specificity factor MinE